MPTSSRDMSDIIRRKRREIADMPMMDDDSDTKVAVKVESKPESETETPKTMTVAAPGEPSTGESFEYEPFTDAPGAWVVYPPGVPCDDAEYRVQLDHPATESDFPKMQEALDRAGAPSSGPDELAEEDMETY